MSKQIPAVGYLRKSTKGERADGKQKQEKSIGQQKAEIRKLAAGKYEILDWFTDEGVSGWKRGAKRPDFQRMLDKVQELGAQAILCDNIDRFSRAAVADVQEDTNALRKAGVRWIVTASHGEYDLGSRYDIGDILKFVVAVWTACEYSRQLGRRIALARRNRAEEGKRSGGPVPYGWRTTGDGGLEFGDRKHVKIVRWIFAQFNNGESYRWIAEQLNYVKKVPSPRNGKGWGVRTIKMLLQNPVYIGEFQYGRQRAGQFYTHDERGEVVPVEQAAQPGKLFVAPRRYKPMVAPATFAKAQQRMAAKTAVRTKRNRAYALSGILVCGHCGRNLHATRIRKHIVYRCTANQHLGNGTCEQWAVREDRILPFIFKALLEELSSIQKLLTAPPRKLLPSKNTGSAQRKRLQQQRDRLAKKIAVNMEALMDTADKRSRRDIEQRITAMRDQLENLEAALNNQADDSADARKRQWEELMDFWKRFNNRAVELSVPGHLCAAFNNSLIPDGFDPLEDDLPVMLDPQLVNQALQELGGKMTFTWETIEAGKSRAFVAPNGKQYRRPIRRHHLKHWRFQLGARRYRSDTTASRCGCSCWSRPQPSREGASPC